MFKGKSRTLNEIKPEKNTNNLSESIDMKSPPPPELIPSPGKRFTKILSRPKKSIEKPLPPQPELPLNLISITSKQLSTFGITCVKFDIRANGELWSIEGRFMIKEPGFSLYEYLENEIFSNASKIEIFHTFPRIPILKCDDTLSVLKIKGQVALQVNVIGDIEFKI